MAISDDDLDDCFSTDDFAVEGIFETSSGSIAVNGYYTGPTEAVTINGTTVEASAPTFQCRTSEIAAVRRGDILTVPIEDEDGVPVDTDLTVERYQQVGTGVSVVYLKT